MPRWRKTVIVLCAAAGLIALLCTSESFETCIHERKNHQEYQALQEKVSLPIKTIVRSKLHLVCARVTASNSENAGVIAALAGVVVAWFTFALWRSTDKLWLAAEKQSSDMKTSLSIAKEAADAARDSADALINLERPWLVAVSDEAELTPTIEGAIKEDDWVTDINATVSFINEGRTTAFLGRFHTEAAISGYPRPAKGFSFEIDNENSALGPGNEIHFPIGVGAGLNGKAAIRILEGDAVIWMFGYLEYYDFFQKRRITHFCFNHNMGVGCITPWGGKNENYMT